MATTISRMMMERWHHQWRRRRKHDEDSCCAVATTFHRRVVSIFIKRDRVSASRKQGAPIIFHRFCKHYHASSAPAKHILLAQSSIVSSLGSLWACGRLSVGCLTNTYVADPIVHPLATLVTTPPPWWRCTAGGRWFGFISCGTWPYIMCLLFRHQERCHHGHQFMMLAMKIATAIKTMPIRTDCHE